MKVIYVAPGYRQRPWIAVVALMTALSATTGNAGATQMWWSALVDTVIDRAVAGRGGTPS